MIIRIQKNPLQLSLAMLALAFACFAITTQTEQFSAFAQPSEQAEDSSELESNSNLDSIELHQFTFWDAWIAATMAIINPYGLSDKSVIYLYKFDQEGVRDALSQIQKIQSEILKEKWYVGQVTVESGDEESAIWRPAKLNLFNLESELSESTQLFASNLPIPDEEYTDAYWIPYDEWATLLGLREDANFTAVASDDLTQQQF